MSGANFIKAARFALNKSISFSQSRALFYTPPSLQSRGGRSSIFDDVGEDPFAKIRSRFKVKDNEFEKDQNGFQLFGLEEKFQVDLNKLKREMRNLQNILHPDRFVTRSVKDQENSDLLSSLVNDYYYILGHPYERGKYLLQLVTNKSRNEVENMLDKVQLDSKFLSDMMELRENVQDESIDLRDLSRLAMDLEMDLRKLSSDLDQGFKTKDFESIKINLAKMKFVANCHRAANDRLGNFNAT